MSASVSEFLAAEQLRRASRFWAKFDQTGDVRWMRAAMNADRYYRLMRKRASS